MDSNSQKIAATATERLVKEGLIAPERRRRFLELLGTGRLRQDDWRLELEQAHANRKAP